jgi:organic hydroperoxide reductase OsmC/OhrA
MTGKGLRGYIERKGAAMRAAAVARPTAAEWREEVRAVVVADDETGVRKMRIRDWEVIGDSGPSFGGESRGPSSPELLCGVLGTCLAHTYQIGAVTLGLPIGRVEVEVIAQNNDAGLLGISSDDPHVPWGITAKVSLMAEGVPEADIEALHAWVRTHCPLTNLIRTPNEVTIEVR